MENPRARNDAIERLLREANGAVGGAAAGTCAAPEEVAAWLEGGLSAAEAARLEAHAASCPDCQALVAAFARTLPPVQARAWASMRWAVPMAAAAVLVLGVWLTRPDRLAPSTATPESSVARLEDAPMAELPSAVPNREQSADRRLNPQRQAPQDRPALSERFAPAAAEAVPTVPAAPPAAVAAPPAELTLNAEQKAERSEERAKALAPAVAAAPLARAAEADRGASPPAAVSSALGAAAARGAGDQPRQAPAAAAFRSRADATLVTVASPSGRWRCRVASGSAVEASSDGGVNWAIVGGSTPAVGGAVTGGTSPSDGVCWLVGRGGLVLLVRSGLATAMRLPDAGDLTTAQAEDAGAVLVRGADGRAWRTRDDGRTWIAVPAGR